MTCIEVRDALSALLDGEDPGVDEAAVRRHLADCSGCADWQRQWHAVAGRSRVASADAVPDLSDRILRAIQADRPERQQGWQVSLRRWPTVGLSQWQPRAALALVGLAQLAIAAPMLVSGHDHAAPEHVAHELGSFAVALSVAFLAAAVLPRLALGTIPVVGVTVAFITLTAAGDVVSQQAELHDELPHLLLLIGFLLLCRLAAGSSTRPSARPKSSPAAGAARQTVQEQPLNRRAFATPIVARLEQAAQRLGPLWTRPLSSRWHTATAPRPGRAARLSMVVVVAFLAVVTVASPASAHATLSSSSPSPGDLLPAAPTGVELRFDETVTTVPDSLRVLGPDGSRADTGVTHRGGDGSTIAVGLRDRPSKGTYLVSWRIVSADGHPVSGAFTFSVGTTSTPPVADGGSGPTTGLVLGLSRLGGYLGLVLLLGSAIFLALCWPDGWRERRARRLMLAGWATSVVAVLLALLVKGADDAGLGLSQAGRWDLLQQVLGTTYGKAMTVRLVLLLGLAAWYPFRSTVRPLAARTAAAVAGVIFVGTFATAGHAVADAARPVAVISDMLHVTAMAAWVGGLVVLVAVVLPHPDPAAAARAVPRFSRLAATAVAVLVVTGSYQAWRQVGGLAALTETSYGWDLVVKLGLVMIALTFAATSRSCVRALYGTPRPVVYAAAADDVLDAEPGGHVLDTALPDGQPDNESETRQTLRRTVAMEAGTAFLILCVTAALVATVPARAAYRPKVDETLRLGPLTAEVSAVPATDRAMDLHLTLLGPDGSPVDPAEVTADVRLPDRQLGPLPLTLQAAGVGHEITTVTVPVRGDWTLTVSARTTDFDVYTGQVTLPVR